MSIWGELWRLSVTALKNEADAQSRFNLVSSLKSLAKLIAPSEATQFLSATLHAETHPESPHWELEMRQEHFIISALTHGLLSAASRLGHPEEQTSLLSDGEIIV